MKRIANSGEAAEPEEDIVDPEQAEVPLGAVPVEARATAVATGELPHRAVTLYSAPSVPLPIEYSLGCIFFGSYRPIA